MQPDPVMLEHNFKDQADQLLRSQRQGQFIFDRIEAKYEGGIYIYYKGVPFPTKGFVWPQAVAANNVVKRMLLSTFIPLSYPGSWLYWLTFAISPKRWKAMTLNVFTHHFARALDQWLMPFYWGNPMFYCTFVRNFNALLKQTLINFGVEEGNAFFMAKVLGHVIEYDDAYRHRIQDIFSEFERAEIVADPRKALIKAMSLYAEREHSDYVGQKFLRVGKLLSYALWIPSVKKAIVRAFTHKSVDFRGLQLDDADKYHLLINIDYDYFGETFETRIKRWRMHYHPAGDPPRQMVGGHEFADNLAKQTNTTGVPQMSEPITTQAALNPEALEHLTGTSVMTGTTASLIDNLPASVDTGTQSADKEAVS